MKLISIAILTAAALGASGASASEASPELRYCTQYGPFFIKFDHEKAAGVFAILTNGDMGSMVGRLNGQTLEGEWIEVDSGGQIRIEFAEDRSSFEATYNTRNNPEKWHSNWTGRLPDDPDAETFTADGVLFRCR